MSGIVVPGKFGSPGKRARDDMNSQIQMLLVPYLGGLGWDTVANDLLTMAAGLISTGSDKPARDLAIAAAYVKKYNWRRAKRMLFAARQGIQPEDVSEDMLRDFEVVEPDGESPPANEGEEVLAPQPEPS